MMTTLMTRPESKQVDKPTEKERRVLEIAASVKLPKWEVFSDEVMAGKGILMVDGSDPDKIVEAADAEQALKVAGLMKAGKVTNFVVYSVAGFGRGYSLMAAAMLMADLGRIIGREPRLWMLGESVPELTKANGNIIRVWISEMRSGSEKLENYVQRGAGDKTAD